jgi:hypothetical protein
MKGMSTTTVVYFHLGHIVLWAVALIAAMLVLLAGMLLASLWRFWHGRWPQFGLRAVFVAMTLSAALAGCAAYLFRDVDIVTHDIYFHWSP